MKSFVVPLLAALAFSPAAGATPCVLIADEGNHSIIQFDPAANALTYLSLGGHLDGPSGLFADADGTIVVSDSRAFDDARGGTHVSVDTAPGGLIRINPATREQTVISRGGIFGNVESVVRGPDGMLYVADYGHLDGTGGVIRVDAATGEQTAVSMGGSLVATFGLAFDSSKTLLVTDAEDWAAGTGALYRIDVATGAQTLVSRDGLFQDPFGVAVAGDGTIIVSDLGGKLVLVDPETGEQTLLADGFSTPAGVAVDGDTVVLADHSAFDGGALYRVSLMTGERELLTLFPPNFAPVGLALAAECFIADWLVWPAAEIPEPEPEPEPSRGIVAAAPPQPRPAPPARPVAAAPPAFAPLLVTAGGWTGLVDPRTGVPLAAGLSGVG